MTPKVSQDWTKLETIAKESVEDCEGVELIGDSSISVRDKDGLYPFALVLVVAHELNFSYRVDLFFILIILYVMSVNIANHFFPSIR